MLCKIWLVAYKIGEVWQKDGEWFSSEEAAVSQAKSNERDLGWKYRIREVELKSPPTAHPKIKFTE